ncbi:MAG: hypothetical protein ACU85E_14385 [Gammaproteobacteria bacterium]
MARGGYRPNSGPKKGTKYQPRGSKSSKKGETPRDIKNDAKKSKLTPLEYMIQVMNDEGAEKERRDRMAQIAAPFVHPRLVEQRGSKDEKKDRAKAAGKGRFAPCAPPQLKAVK